MESPTFFTAKELIILGSLLLPEGSQHGILPWKPLSSLSLPLGRIYQARHIHQAQKVSLKPGAAKKSHLGI